MSFAFLLCSLALADPADALDPLTRPYFERAEAEAATAQWAQAIVFYRLVLTKDPAFLPAALGVGQCLVGMGERAEAIRFYESLGNEPDAVEALAKLVQSNNPAYALTLWKKLQSLRLGDPVPLCEQAQLLTENNPETGLVADLDAALESFEHCERLLQGEEPDPAILLTIVDALLVAERKEGKQLLEHYASSWPEGKATLEVQRRLDRLDIEQAAERLPLRSDLPLTASQQDQARTAWEALSLGKLEEAERLATELVSETPRAADAHGLLSEIFQRQSRWDDAELHALIARNLAPDDASTRLRYGLLLMDLYGGRRNAEAAVELREAAALRPESPELRYQVGLVEQSLQNYEASILAYQVYLSSQPVGIDAMNALARLEDLQRAAPPAPPPPPPPRLPPEAASHFRIALELFARDRKEEALNELHQALSIAPNAPELLNYQARLALEEGDILKAMELFGRSLERDPLQGPVLLGMGELAEKQGDPELARQHYTQAAQAGEADAHFLLARMAAARGDWEITRKELASWSARASSVSPYQEAARRLSHEATTRYLLLRGLIAASVSIILLLPLAFLLWRFTAKPLHSLLDREPDCWHDAARILSAVRHELLKHNTTILPDIAKAVSEGNLEPWENFNAADLLERLNTALTSLEKLGAQYRMRLDLRHRDPILSPMYKAMKRLSRISSPKAEELLSLSKAINETGYQAIGRMMQEICVLKLTAGHIQRVYERVIGEPGIAGAAVPDLEVEATGEVLALRIFPNDLEDILANLLRNALAAGASWIGVRLGGSADPITGVEYVELAICDDAPGILTNQLLRRRHIGRGLGLAVDLVNRHEGEIRVEPGKKAGEKAVVVCFPRVEVEL